jgi:hypothetical protein
MTLAVAYAVRVFVLVPLAAAVAAAYAVGPEATRMWHNWGWLRVAEGERDRALALGLEPNQVVIAEALAQVDITPWDWPGVWARLTVATAVVLPVAIVAGWALMLAGARRTLRDMPPQHAGWVLPNGGEWWAYGRVGPIRYVQTDPDAKPILGPTLGWALWRARRAVVTDDDASLGVEE